MLGETIDKITNNYKQKYVIAEITSLFIDCGISCQMIWSLIQVKSVLMKDKIY